MVTFHGRCSSSRRGGLAGQPRRSSLGTQCPWQPPAAPVLQLPLCWQESSEYWTVPPTSRRATSPPAGQIANRLLSFSMQPRNQPEKNWVAEPQPAPPPLQLHYFRLIPLVGEVQSLD